MRRQGPITFLREMAAIGAVLKHIDDICHIGCSVRFSDGGRLCVINYKGHPLARGQASEDVEHKAASALKAAVHKLHEQASARQAQKRRKRNDGQAHA